MESTLTVQPYFFLPFLFINGATDRGQVLAFLRDCERGGANAATSAKFCQSILSNRKVERGKFGKEESPRARPRHVGDGNGGDLSETAAAEKIRNLHAGSPSLDEISPLDGIFVVSVRHRTVRSCRANDEEPRLSIRSATGAGRCSFSSTRRGYY